MAIFTTEELAAQITAWKACLLAISHSQEYTVGIRRYTKADLPEVRKTLAYLDEEQAKLANALSGPVFSSPRIAR